MYLDSLVQRIDVAGYENEPLIIHSGDGVMTIGATRLIPARTCLSGLAAGVIRGLLAGTTAGFNNII